MRMKIKKNIRKKSDVSTDWRTIELNFVSFKRVIFEIV
jgi:hypothetical protein